MFVCKQMAVRRIVKPFPSLDARLDERMQIKRDALA